MGALFRIGHDLTNSSANEKIKAFDLNMLITESRSGFLTSMDRKHRIHKSC